MIRSFAFLVVLVVVAMASTVNAELFTGKWKMTYARNGEKKLYTAPKQKEHESPAAMAKDTVKPVYISITHHENENGVATKNHMYDIRIAASNKFSGKVKTGIVSANGQKASVHISTLASTRMMPSEEMQPTENFINEHFPKVDLFEVKGGDLYMIGSDEVIIKCVRVQK